MGIIDINDPEKIPELFDPCSTPRVHAHWEWDENALDWNIGAWVCSECGMNYADVEVATRHDINVNVWACSNFCGHCGAIMDKKKEG